MTETKFEPRDITTPKNGYTTYTNRHWLCMDGEPTKALFYGNSPQCNSDIRIQEGHIGYVKTKVGDNVSIVFVPVAYVKPRD